VATLFRRPGNHAQRLAPQRIPRCSERASLRASSTWSAAWPPYQFADITDRRIQRQDATRQIDAAQGGHFADRDAAHGAETGE
jgi:hypothetical protein